MKSFLDLPAEIRNNIYKLVSNSLLYAENGMSCNKYWHPGFIIWRDEHGHAHLPAVTVTCRQIREEFPSQELPRCKIFFEFGKVVHEWDRFADVTFTKYLKHLTYSSWYVETYISDSVSADERDRLGWLSGTLFIRAKYRDVPGAEPIIRFEFEFFHNDLALDEYSKTLIRQALSSLLPECVALTARDFVQALDRVGQLKLYYREFRKPDLVASHVNEPQLDFTITQSPRRLHEVESGKSVFADGRKVPYERNVVDTFEEILDE